MEYIITQNNRILTRKLESYRAIPWPEVYNERPNIYEGKDILADEDMKHYLLQNVEVCISHLVNYFELFEILRVADQFATAKGIVLVKNTKTIPGIIRKLVVRGKGLNDMVRCTLLSSNVNDFLQLASTLAQNYHVALKKEMKKGSSWPIPKLLVWCRGKSIGGKVATLEIQFSSHEIFCLVHSSSFHVVYEALRESTGFSTSRAGDKAYNAFLQRLNKDINVRGQITTGLSSEVGEFAIKEPSNSEPIGLTGKMNNSFYFPLPKIIYIRRYYHE